MKVSDYIAEVIGSYRPFVVQGGAAVHMIDSLARGGHKYVCCAHEQAAGFAADGYAKVRGLGVAVTTCGPGATNLLTAAASAFAENVPVLYLVGQQHGFQELDVVGMFRSVTRYAVRIDRPNMVASRLRRALKHVVEGPVLLNIFDEVYRDDIKDKPSRPTPYVYSAPETDLIFSKKRAALPKGAVFEGKGYVNPYYFMRELKKRSCQVVTGIGNHGVWVKQSVPAISDNNFGAMGYAIAASMGVACAGKSVACVTGDGAIQMNIQELATIAKHDLDIKIFILNNGGYGMIRCTQDTWLEGRHFGCDHEDLPKLDFEAIALAYGIPSRTWKTHKDINFESIFSMPWPFLVNVVVDPEQKIYE